MKITAGRRTPEMGEQVLTITKVEHDVKFGKMQLSFRSANGATVFETYRLEKANGEPNDVALDIFSSLAHCALHDWEVEDIDPASLVGLQVVATLSQEVYENQKGEERTATRIKNFKEAPIEDDIDLDDLE